VPALKAGEDDSSKHGSRFRITHIMEALARRSGDVEALVAVKQRDLSSAYAYLQIAEAYMKGGLHDQALSWAERGLEAFPFRTDSRLREFVAAEYHQEGAPRRAHGDRVGRVRRLAVPRTAPAPEGARRSHRAGIRVGDLGSI
jgi:hypothetical protein